MKMEIKELRERLKKVRVNNVKAFRAFVIALYYTGARPREIIRMKSKHIKKDNNYLSIHIPDNKEGTDRKIPIIYTRSLIKELYNYAASCPEDMYLFYMYRPSHGSTDYTNKLRYPFHKFLGVSPMYFRHNRFAKMARKGASLKQLKYFKGTTHYKSVFRYINIDEEKAKKSASLID